MQGIQSISLMHFTQCKGSRVDESDSLLDFLVIHVVPDPLVRIARDGFPPTTLPLCFELVFHVHHHHHERCRSKHLQYLPQLLMRSHYYTNNDIYHV